MNKPSRALGHMRASPESPRQSGLPLGRLILPVLFDGECLNPLTCLQSLHPPSRPVATVWPGLPVCRLMLPFLFDGDCLNPLTGLQSLHQPSRPVATAGPGLGAILGIA